MCREYTGNIGVSAEDLFAFVESQREPADDDVVVLVGGGVFS